MATDKTEVLATVGDLLSVGARLGATQVLYHANLIAQREAAEVRDLPQSPAFGRRLKAAPEPHAANDHEPTSNTA